MKRGEWIETIDAPQTARDILANKWYASAKLVPFPNRVRDGRYRSGAGGPVSYLNRNFPSQGHAIHGLVYNKKWTLRKIGIEGDSNTIVIGCIVRPVRGYRHTLDVSCEYMLEGQSLTCKTIVRNVGRSAAPVGDGWHPYFVAKGRTAFVDSSFERSIVVDDRMIPVGKTSPAMASLKLLYLNGFKSGGAVVDTCFILGKKRKRETVLRTSIYTLTLNQDSSYPFLQVFTPPGRQSIAIEPMSCWTDAFNNKKNLRILRPGKSFSGTYSIAIK